MGRVTRRPPQGPGNPPNSRPDEGQRSVELISGFGKSRTSSWTIRGTDAGVIRAGDASGPANFLGMRRISFLLTAACLAFVLGAPVGSAGESCASATVEPRYGDEEMTVVLTLDLSDCRGFKRQGPRIEGAMDKDSNLTSGNTRASGGCSYPECEFPLSIRHTTEVMATYDGKFWFPGPRGWKPIIFHYNCTIGIGCM